jgi:hypothetical protein
MFNKIFGFLDQILFGFLNPILILNIESLILFLSLIFTLTLSKSKYYLYILIFLFLLFYNNLFGITSFLAVLVFLFSCTIVGGYFRYKIEGLKDYLRLENIILGLCIFGIIITYSSYFQINYKINIFLIVIIPIIFFLFKEYNYFRENLVNFNNLILNEKSNYKFNFFITFFILSIFCLIAFPDLGHDARSMHVTVPVKMLEYGKWKYDINDYVWSVYPKGAQWLFTIVYFLSDEQSIRLLSISLTIINSFLIYQFLKDKIDKKLAIIASFIFLTLPEVFHLVGSAWSEPMQTLLFTIVLIELYKKNKNYLLLFIFLGYSLNVKFTSFIIIFFSYLFLFYDLIIKKEKLNKLFSCTAILIFFGFFPYFISYIKTGSPTFPLFNEIFKSNFISKDAFYHPLFGKIAFSDFWMTSFNSAKYGSPGAALGLFFVSLFPLSLLFLREKKNLIFLAIAFSFIIIIWHKQAYLRYVYAIFPWLIIISFLNLNLLYKKNNLVKKVIKYVALIIIFINLIFLSKSYQRVQNVKFYLNKEFNIETKNNLNPIFEISDYVKNNRNIKNILLLGYAPTFADFPDTLITLSWHSINFWYYSLSTEKLEKILKKFEIEYVIYPENYKEENQAFQHFNKIKDFPQKLMYKKNNFLLVKINYN